MSSMGILKTEKATVRDLTQRRFVVTDVSGQPSTACPLKMGQVDAKRQ
jgi:hypothetical protein